MLIYALWSFLVKIHFDSGSLGNYISSCVLSTCNVPRQQSPTCYQITSIQGKLGTGAWKTLEASLCIGWLHEETISMLVLEESAVDVILGLPWLAKHQPNIGWSSGSIEQWSDYCIHHCLWPLPVPSQKTPILGSTSIESLATSTQVNLPEEYWAFQDVFSKTAATKLPPHWP